jgi:hypothetical protein
MINEIIHHKQPEVKFHLVRVYTHNPHIYLDIDTIIKVLSIIASGKVCVPVASFVWYKTLKRGVWFNSWTK